MASETEIANLALSHIAQGAEIAILETERSAAASACRRFFKLARNTALRDFTWPFATKIVALALLDDNPFEDEWPYAYRMPVDCKFFRRILSGTRNDTEDSVIRFKISADDSGGVILTDQREAYAEYTRLVEDPSFYTDDFIEAMSYRLAYLIAPRLTKGDPHKLGARAHQLYYIEIQKAKAAARNEERLDKEPPSSFERARE